MSTIAIYNLKGGVGKTSASVNLAAIAAAEGKKTLLWDLDPQGAASFFFESESAKKNVSRKAIAGDVELSRAIQPTSYENLWIIPADISAAQADVALSDSYAAKKKLASQLAEVKDAFDVIILDSPPGISLLQENIFFAADWIIVPNIPSTLSIRSFDTVAEYLDRHHLNTNKLYSFFSMVDHRKLIHQDVINAARRDKRFLHTFIPLASDVEKMGIHQAPVAAFAPNSAAAVAYYNLWKELARLTKS